MTITTTSLGEAKAGTEYFKYHNHVQYQYC